jgi:arylsulfatase A-like enzyme
MAAGPSIEVCGQIEARVADVTATLLERMGVAVPPDFEGRVLWEILSKPDGIGRAALPSKDISEVPQRNFAKVAERLRALGYID